MVRNLRWVCFIVLILLLLCEKNGGTMVAMNKSGRSNIYIESPSENAASRDASRELRHWRSTGGFQAREKNKKRERNGKIVGYGVNAEFSFCISAMRQSRVKKVRDWHARACLQKRNCRFLSGY